MKKLFTVIAVAAFIIACNNTETKTGTASDTTRIDSAAQNVMDTSKKIMNQVKDVLDSAAKKMDTAAGKLKEASDKMKK